MDNVTLKPVLVEGVMLHLLDPGVEENRTCLTPDQVTQLRAILQNYDEHATRPDDAQTRIAYLDDGQIVTTWEV